jgi:hypothetical protein
MLLVAAGACSSKADTDNGQLQPSSTGTSSSGRSAPFTSSNGGMSQLDASVSMDSGRPSTATGNAADSGSDSGFDAGASDAAQASNTAGAGGAAGASGSGGKAGSTAGAGGTVASAGSGGGPRRGTRPDDEDAGVCVVPDESVDVSNAKRCPAEVCPAQDSICLPATSLALLVPQSTIDLLGNCTETDKCVPIVMVEKAGKGILPSCRSINGVEGRCTSQCVPLVASQATLLPKDTCQGEDLCAPCFDPRTGEDTLACRQGCDPGPTEGPKPFAKCCSDRGLCVPPELAAGQAKNLNVDTCETGTLCAPTELTDPTFKAKACDSIDGAEGRCISTCVGGAVAKQKDRLPTAGCAAEEVCAPCFDPITGEDTGACSVNGDAPTKPKQVFDRCCGMVGDQPVGVCVPPALAGSQAGILRQETCGEGKLCAPIKKAEDPAFKFPTCNSLLGAGACVNSCIPDQTQAALLSRASCEMGELCAPCNLLGSNTGACD